MAKTWTSSSFSTDNQYIKYRIQVTENSTNIVNNTSNVTVTVDAWRTNTGYTTSGTGTCYCTIGGTKYSNSISASQTITHNSHTVLYRRSNFNVAHGADGKKSLSVSAYIKHQRFDSSSHGFTVTLTDIPREAHITGADTVTDETQTTNIFVDSPAGEAVEALALCLSLDGETPLGSWRALSTSGGNYQIEITQAEITALLQACPNANTLNFYYLLKTTIAGVEYTNSYEALFNVVNANPTITGASYEDNNPVTLAITNNSAQIIQNNSTVLFNFTTLTALKYATLASIAVTVSGVTQTLALSGTSVSNTQIAWGVINSSNNINAVIVLTDSRGNTTALSLPITMLAWALPNAIISCERLNNFYDDTLLNVNGNMSSLDNKNLMTLSFKYKEDGSSSWSAEIPLVDEQTYTVSLDRTKIWDIQVIVADRIGQTLYNLKVQKGVPIVFFDRLKNSFSVEKLPALSNGVDSAGNINTDADVTAGNDISATRDVIAGRDLSATNDVNAGADVNAVGSVTGADASFSGNVTANSVTLPHKYSTTEQIVGYWLDDRPIYKRVIELTTDVSVSANAWKNSALTVDEDIIIVGGKAMYYSSQYDMFTIWNFMAIQTNTSNKKAIDLYNARDATCNVNMLIIEYIKPTI